MKSTLGSGDGANFRWLSDETEPGLFAGSMPTFNQLHLQFFSTMENKLKEGIHSCAVRSSQTNCLVCSMGWRCKEFSLSEHLMLVRPRSVSADQHLRVFTQERLRKSSWAGSRDWEGSWWSSATPLVPSLGKLWNTPCVECIQNIVSDIRNKSDITFN